MSDQQASDADPDIDESEVTQPAEKALEWRTTALDLIDKKEELSEEEELSSDSSSSDSSSSDSSSSKSSNKNQQKIFDDKAASKQVSSLDLHKPQKQLVVNNSPQNSPLKTNNKTLPDPWDDNIEDIQMKDPPIEINILLLGESGVGKSTFINSFANYMKHENFEAVQENDLRVLIPARFSIFDKDFQKHVIEIGANDENEYLADGAAATQDVKTYVFHITLDTKSYLIRLIDTPGMGDPRGIDQDNKNCDYVLNYLGRLEKIHAICLLLKPTNSRLDVFLNYCVTQILSRLEKSATENIAFLFTNTRGQNYTPGETYTSLEVLVKKIKDRNNVSLPLSHKNVFCFDNEAFRFLASIKQGVEFREGILEANIESWKYSYKEVYRLLSYIVQLKPHDPKKTISINHARKMVLQLAQPLAEIVQLIGDNIYQLDQHTNQLLMENQTLEELKQKLHMPVVDIRVKELSQPVTVCTAPQCSTIYKVADKNKFHYKQRCHNPCYLNNVPAEIVGDPHLLDCWAMTRSTQTCHECGCRFNTHMHIYYETDTFENKIVDQNVLKNITSKEDATKQKQIMINKICDHKTELEKEHTYIIKCSATFAHFLQHNAITPINDSLKEYVKYLITREESLGPQADRANLDYLKRLLAEYEQEKSVLETALKHNTSGSSIINTSPNAIETKIKDLFTLPHFGKKIKQLYDLHQTGGLREHKQSEFVVKERYTLSLLDKVTSSVKSSVKSAASYLGFGKSKKWNREEFEQRRALEYERDLAYDRALEYVRTYQYQQHNQLQRRERLPEMQQNFQFSGSYENSYFGPPNAHKDPFQEWGASSYRWDENQYLPNSGRQQRQYALENLEEDFKATFKYREENGGHQVPTDYRKIHYGDDKTHNYYKDVHSKIKRCENKLNALEDGEQVGKRQPLTNQNKESLENIRKKALEKQQKLNSVSTFQVVKVLNPPKTANTQNENGETDDSDETENGGNRKGKKNKKKKNKKNKKK